MLDVSLYFSDTLMVWILIVDALSGKETTSTYNLWNSVQFAENLLCFCYLTWSFIIDVSFVFISRYVYPIYTIVIMKGRCNDLYSCDTIFVRLWKVIMILSMSQ